MKRLAQHWLIGYYDGTLAIGCQCPRGWTQIRMSASRPHQFRRRLGALFWSTTRHFIPRLNIRIWRNLHFRLAQNSNSYPSILDCLIWLWPAVITCAPRVEVDMLVLDPSPSYIHRPSRATWICPRIWRGHHPKTTTPFCMVVMDHIYTPMLER